MKFKNPFAKKIEENKIDPKFKYNFTITVVTTTRRVQYTGLSIHKTAFGVPTYRNIWKWFNLRDSEFYLLEWKYKDSISHNTFYRHLVNEITFDISPIKSKPPVDS